MDKEFEKKLDFDSDTFEDLKKDMNFILQRLVGTMLEKGATEGSMTLKMDVAMIKEFIPNYDPDTKGETREVSKPQFKHKVTSAVKINDDKSGTFNNEMELVMDEETGVYVLTPIANTSQRSIFDSDFQQQNSDEKCVNDEWSDNEPAVIEGECRPLLPGTSDEDIVDAEVTPVEEETPTEDGEEPEAEDITDELLGENQEEDDGYSYDEPEDEE